METTTYRGSLWGRWVGALSAGAGGRPDYFLRQWSRGRPFNWHVNREGFKGSPDVKMSTLKLKQATKHLTTGTFSIYLIGLSQLLPLSNHDSRI